MEMEMAPTKEPSSTAAAARENQSAAKAAGSEQVQEAFDEAAEQGFFGESPDETPRDHYTNKGVGSDKPTPETERGKELLK